MCKCIEGYNGSPPSCRPECVVSSDCSPATACVNQKCINPCLGSCGLNAECTVINHNPICSCRQGFTGNPFQACLIPPRKPFPDYYKFLQNFKIMLIISFFLPAISDITVRPTDPCIPSPCGPQSQCQVKNGLPSCANIPQSIGSPGCVSNSECSSNQACINRKCADPCTESCGSNTECRVFSHTPMCLCSSGYTGDPFTRCTPILCEFHFFMCLRVYLM